MLRLILRLLVIYAGYCAAGFVLLAVAGALFGEGTVAEAERAVALVLLGTLALNLAGILAARRWAWSAAPTGPARTVALVAFVALLLGTLVAQLLSTLVVFNR